MLRATAGAVLLGSLPSAYNLATAGAMTPGNGISGYSPPSGPFQQFFDNLNPPWASAPTPDDLRLAPSSGWVRWIHVKPSGSGSQDGLSESNAMSLFDARAAFNAGTFGAGDWILIYDGLHLLTQDASRFGFFDVHGTPTNPIRMIGESLWGATIRETTSDAGWDVLGFTDCSYWGIHGIDIDGNADGSGLSGPGRGNTWCLNPGVRYGGDARAAHPNCHHFDIWHCEIHHAQQECLHFGSHTGATNSTDVHAHGCYIHDAGFQLHNNTYGASGPPYENYYGELVYFGDGSSSPTGHVENAVVDWCHLEKAYKGEAIDFKPGSSPVGAKALHNYIHDVYVHSQSAITHWGGTGGEIAYNIIHDVHKVPPTDPPAPHAEAPNVAHYEAHGINTGYGGTNIHHNVGWDMDSVLVHLYYYLSNSSTTIENNTGGLALPSEPLFGHGSPPAGGGSYTAPSFSNNLGIGSPGFGATAAVSGDFVNAEGAGLDSDVGGRAGAGMQLASGSAIAATVGAMGKAA